MSIPVLLLRALVFILPLASSMGLYTNHGEGSNPGRPARIEGIRAAALRQLLEGRRDWKAPPLLQEDLLERELAKKTLAEKEIVQSNSHWIALEKVERSVVDAGETKSSPEEGEKVVQTSTLKTEGVDSSARDDEKVEPSPEKREKVESSVVNAGETKSLPEEGEKVVETSTIKTEEMDSSARDGEKVEPSPEEREKKVELLPEGMRKDAQKNTSTGEKWERNTLPRPGPDEVPVGMRPLRAQPPILNLKHEFRYPVVRRDTSGVLVLEEEPGLALDTRPLSLQTSPSNPHSRHDGPCGGTYTHLSGIVSSPDYPFNYPNNIYCIYRIQLPAEYTVGLDCNDFTVQPGDQKCENDFLAVVQDDLNVENVERYCGDKALALFSSTSNMTLVFRTDGSYRYRGFMCRYRALNPDGTGADGTVIVNTTVEQHNTICTGPGDDGWQGKCGVSTSDNTRIVGGHITREHQFPWMVAVLKVCGREMDQYCNICGGTVINPRWILTGAHCIVSVPVEDLAMLLGDHNLYTLTPSQKFFRVEAVYIHPDFNVPKPLNNDVALAGLPQEMAFGRYVAPICLPPRNYMDLLNMLPPKLVPENNTTDGGTRQVDTPEAITTIHKNLNSRNISVYGWGTIDDDGEPAQRLRQVTVKVLANSECEYYYGQVVTQKMMCTSGAGGRGPCRGDSGSPAQMEMVDGRWVQVGVLAFGAAYGCEVGFPSGNVLLPLYIDWIAFVTGFDYSQYY
ncbi:uncharacterized protein [Panulirus ornatus]|uniref:uncharacterized protein n=1 Tax=Panulirus ornatus TaxID=150431 RepID=UPI003A84F21D